MHVPGMQLVPGRDGVASESCAVRVSGQMARQAGQQVVMTLPAKLEELKELIELMDLKQLAVPT